LRFGQAWPHTIPPEPLPQEVYNFARFLREKAADESVLDFFDNKFLRAHIVIYRRIMRVCNPLAVAL
jgi:hypothetical protein